jgi:hypothetical protein
MTVDERSRLLLAEALKRALGDEEGITLMELLPPVGWAVIAVALPVWTLVVSWLLFSKQRGAPAGTTPAASTPVS